MEHVLYWTKSTPATLITTQKKDTQWLYLCMIHKNIFVSIKSVRIVLLGTLLTFEKIIKTQILCIQDIPRKRTEGHLRPIKQKLCSRNYAPKSNKVIIIMQGAHGHTRKKFLQWGWIPLMLQAQHTWSTKKQLLLCTHTKQNRDG